MACLKLGQFVGLDGGVDDQLGLGLSGKGDAGQHQRAEHGGEFHRKSSQVAEW